MNAALFSNQPAEGTSGLTNAEIASVVGQAGVTDVKVVKCINDEKYVPWVTDATERTRSAIPNSELSEIGGTPTVIVNGQQYKGNPDDADAFQAFVSEIGIALAPESKDDADTE